ncbi:MAG: Smr/MutS family protein [Deltaproteobacteria bacterium]|nr:Smr/MutS family protein [Deltaproteobacteria bacterium]
MGKKKNDVFNPAFESLEKIVKEAKSKEPVKKIEKKVEKPVIDDEGLFINAMTNVAPISAPKGEKVAPSGKTKKPAHKVSDGDEEVIAHLQSLVAGSIDMDFTFSDEYMEGAISGIGRNTMRKLKRGELPVQAHIDLHGLTKKDAEEAVRRFLITSHYRGLRCVLIIHGRGLNSPDSIPVLKERLPVWLNRGPARKIVMAFSSAQPYDGGTGAIYVLLRK